MKLDFVPGSGHDLANSLRCERRHVVRAANSFPDVGLVGSAEDRAYRILGKCRWQMGAFDPSLAPPRRRQRVADDEPPSTA